jgi:NADPH:quinone reductase-like Zn-dependent oxidoreductase
MKACIYKKYGPPEVVSLAEVEMPVPKSNEILIKVKYATVNRTDCGFRSAEYFTSRLFSGLFRPKNQVLGNEFAGIIEEIGSEVTDFKIGDKVFGYNDKTFGTHAEYVCLNEKSNLALIPENIEINQAAAICEGAHYALCDIRAAKVKAGDEVLVYGATGAIGSSAVQLLKHFGAHVTAVCNAQHVDLILSLGADKVIDYQKEDYSKLPGKFDLIFDAVGKTSFKIGKRVLKEKGIYISTELGKRGANICLALLTPLFSKKKVLFPIPFMYLEDVQFLAGLVLANEFKPLIDRTYSMEQIVEAYQYVESAQKVGNVLLEIDGSC